VESAKRKAFVDIPLTYTLDAYRLYMERIEFYCYSRLISPVVLSHIVLPLISRVSLFLLGYALASAYKAKFR
jgi:hypothetical protein